MKKLFSDDVEGVNFAEDCVIFYKNKTLYKRDFKGVKKLRKLKGKNHKDCDKAIIIDYRISFKEKTNL